MASYTAGPCNQSNPVSLSLKKSCKRVLSDVDQASVCAVINQLLLFAVGADGRALKSSQVGREKSRNTVALSLGVTFSRAFGLKVVSYSIERIRSGKSGLSKKLSPCPVTTSLLKPLTCTVVMKAFFTSLHRS